MIWTDKNFTPDPSLTVKLFDTPDGPYLISQKQLEIMQTCREKTGRQKFIFTASEKWTGKTLGCLDAIIDHAYNTKDSRACVLSTTIGAGDDSGVWTKLTTEIIPSWIAGDFGLDWWMGGKRSVAGPRMKGASKRLYLELTNKFGGKSHIELSSLQMERDVEALFFNRYYDFIYWCELQNFRNRRSFDTLIQSLRRPTIADEDHILLCDGNPSEEGKRAWQYKLFFEDRINPKLPEDQKPIQKNLKLIRLTLDENPFLTDERKSAIKASYAHDPTLFARYVRGEWVEASTDSLFIDVFSRAAHVVGDAGDPDAEVLIPSENCTELFTSWDFGPSNPAVQFFEQYFPTAPQEKRGDGEPQRELSRFHFFDEICFIGTNPQELSLADFTEMVLERMAFWERVIGHPAIWTHFSDRSVMDTYEAVGNRLQHTEVLAASNGKIELIAVDRRPGTVSAAIRFWRRLLFQKRLLFSADRCPNMIAAQTGLSRARGPLGPIPFSIAKGSIHKHPWDSGRYGVTFLCWDEMMESLNDIRTMNKSEMKLISVPL